MERLLRPFGVVIDGVLELGLEVLLADGVIQEIRPHTGIPDSYVLSPAFVNAHSHLEYRGLQGKMAATSYWPWIREIRNAKLEQVLEAVGQDAIIAARENKQTGVAIVGEHSDRPVSGEAMRLAGLGGVIFQEVITRSDSANAVEIMARAGSHAAQQAGQAGVRAYTIPHAYQTVDDDTLRAFGLSGLPVSMHVAESDLENQFSQSGSGSIADTFRSYGVDYQPTGKRLVPTLDDLALLRSSAQLVHCCAIDEADIDLLASRGVTVAHCPRSNVALDCPIAPVREMLDAGIQVGIGLDSAASSGPIDMFAEMRSALFVSLQRGGPVTPEEVWTMATTMGAESIRFAVPDLPIWNIAKGSSTPLIKIHLDDAVTIEDVIARGSPTLVDWA